MRRLIVAVVAAFLAGGLSLPIDLARAQTDKPAASKAKKKTAGKHRLRGDALW